MVNARIANNDDIIKNTLRSKGYAEDEIEEALAEIKSEYNELSSRKQQSIPHPTIRRHDVRTQRQPIIGDRRVQDTPLRSHGNVIQDAIYVNKQSRIIAVADGVTGSGPESARTC